jgi:nitroimidazol reductase NimA-like FMN-containing flavoprotein (pyridoxamine 5'-phosphate oxidase superfamily)
MDEEAARIIREQWFCVLATASSDGVPWASPLFFNVDERYRFVWESSRDAHHSQLIAENPNVALVIANFGSKNADEAVYLACTAREVPPEGLDDALDVFLNGAHKRSDTAPRSVELYLQDQPLRLYEAVPEKAFLLGVSHDAQGRRIDKRREIPLA